MASNLNTLGGNGSGNPTPVAPGSSPTCNRAASAVQTQYDTMAVSGRMWKEAVSLFEEMGIEEDQYDEYELRLEELVEVGLLVKNNVDDEDRVYYSAKEGTTWSNCVAYDCPIKKQILLCLIDNPRTFFVLYNTQKGKLRIAAREIKSWADDKTKKIVGVLIVDNDKTLADQTKDGLINEFEEKAKVFLFSSNEKTTLETIVHYIDAYAADQDGEYMMPVIVALPNNDQMKKVLTILAHIQDKVIKRNSCPLRYGVVFDEADKVYSSVRDKEVMIGNGRRTSFYNLIVENDTAVHRLGFVTATEGDLMDDRFPECANAYMYPVDPSNPDYRAIHHEEAIVKVVAHRIKDSNDIYAENILSANKSHFSQKIRLSNGSEGFRKVIVNGGSKTGSMDTFAKNRNTEGSYAITVNMLGIKVYRPGFEPKRYSSKNIRFGKLLFDIYSELNLGDKPLFIVGRRKVDRGLGFHYAPRDKTEGLIWTDMILCRVDDWKTAVQKAGRLAGLIAHCPQYPMKLVWWTDEKTANTILRHNTVVDEANTKKGCSALQAIERAKVTAPQVGVTLEDTPNDILKSEESFLSAKDAKSWCDINLIHRASEFKLYDIDGNRGNTHFKYRGSLRSVETIEITKSSKDLGWGQDCPRIMPVLVNNLIRYIVIYKRLFLNPSSS